MDLLNQTLNSFSTQISDGGLLDKIFEANLVNLILLDGGLFYILSGALSENLLERKKKILEAIQESEEKLKEATTRLTESRKNLAQANMLVESIQKDAEKTAAKKKRAIAEACVKEVDMLGVKTKLQIATMESRVRKQISDYVLGEALQRTTRELTGKLSDTLQYRILQRSISDYWRVIDPNPNSSRRLVPLAADTDGTYQATETGST